MSEILIRPLVTEKMTGIQEKQGKYGFVVALNANKMEKNYGVTVMQINTIRYDGKNKFRYTKAGIVSGRSASYKKAIVKLAAGETIDFYSNI